MAAGGSSFHKKARVKIGQIPGTRPSLYNNQLLISTGIPSLDVVIGGGLAVGTVILIEEDVYGSYARLMLKYFIAEALMTRQSVFLSSASESPQQLVMELPAAINENNPDGATSLTSASLSSKSVPVQSAAKPTGDSSSSTQNEDEKMKIAWRYQSKPKVQSSPSSSVHFGHYYDLTRIMSQDKVESADISYATYSVTDGQSSVSSDLPQMNPCYLKLLQDIKSRIETGGFHTAQTTEKRNILRIGIQSMASPLWGESGGMKAEGQGHDPSLPLFLIALRGLLRSAFAVAAVTVPSHLFHDYAFVRRIERLADTVVRLESFAGSDKEKNPVFKEYHGLLHLVQLPRLNSLVPAQPEMTDLAFKLRRKKFTIEKLHLPPELADTTGRSQEEDNILSKKTASSPCGQSEHSKLSF